jgi:hypothetical protein
MAGLRLAAQRKTANVSAVPPAAIALGIALGIVPICVRAETKVRGTPQAVVVEARNASVEEVLIALTDTFKVRFRSAANLDRRLTGTYQGTLQQAVSRILRGYDFVVKAGPTGLEITLLGAGTPVAVMGARQATRPADAAAASHLPTAAAASGDRSVPVPLPGSGGPTPPISVAQGPAPVPTLTATGTAVGPVPQLGPGPSPIPSKPGDAPTPAPLLSTALSAAPPSPMPSTSSLAPPISSAPVPSSSATAPPGPSPTR